VARLLLIPLGLKAEKKMLTIDETVYTVKRAEADRVCCPCIVDGKLAARPL
jgi:hypothetical protein